MKVKRCINIGRYRGVSLWKDEKGCLYMGNGKRQSLYARMKRQFPYGERKSASKWMYEKVFILEGNEKVVCIRGIKKFVSLWGKEKVSLPGETKRKTHKKALHGDGGPSPAKRNQSVMHD